MKVKFVSQPILTNGSGFIHQRRFLQNRKVHFPVKLCETYKFCFDHFLKKRTVFILIRKTLLKIKSCGFRVNNARYEKMLTRKIVHFKKIYNFYFDHFLIKCTVFVLNVKNVIKNKKLNFPDKLQHTKQMLKNKIIRFRKIYKFYLDHFLIKWTVFVLNVKNVIKNQKLNFSDKLCDIQKTC